MSPSIEVETAPTPASTELYRKTPISFLAEVWIVLSKDFLIEWRTRSRLNALVFFAVSTLLMFSFALGPNTTLLRQNAAGYLWLALLFASVLSLGESFRIENENAALEGLRLAPTRARAIFLGKAVGNALVLFSLSLVLLPIMVALYDIQIVAGFGKLALTLLSGCMAISAPGTVYSAIANNSRARDVLLPLLLFPLLVPALLAMTKATSLVFQGDPMGQLVSWLQLLWGFGLIYGCLGFLLFPKVIED